MTAAQPYDPDATPRISETYLTFGAEAAQAKEMCRAAASGMSSRPAVFSMEDWKVYQAFAHLFEAMERSFATWKGRPELSFEEKSADIRALQTAKTAATAMIEARRLR